MRTGTRKTDGESVEEREESEEWRGADEKEGVSGLLDRRLILAALSTVERTNRDMAREVEDVSDDNNCSSTITADSDSAQRFHSPSLSSVTTNVGGRERNAQKTEHRAAEIAGLLVLLSGC